MGIEPTSEQIEHMAKSCADNCGGTVGSTKPLTKDDIAAIYRAAM